MRLGKGFLAAGAAAGSVIASAEARIRPAETVEAVATRIERDFYDPDRAREIAAALRAEAAGYDRLTDPHDLANALTDRLKEFDRHFAVRWVGQSPSPAEAASASASAGPDPEIAARRSGYGFRRVEILPGNIGYIDLRSFEPIDFSNREWPIWAAADGALAMLSKTDAIIFDLRHNGGGAPSMVGYLASAFVKSDADVYNVFHSRQGTESEAPAVKYPRPMLDKPVYVLVSGRTGSAAEAFAYTLQAARRATVVGEASAGAANPGGPVATGTGFTVFISDASPKNPLTGGNWETTGVVPDAKVTSADALATAQRLALQTTLPKLPAAEKMEAQWALEALGANGSGEPDLAGLVGKYGRLEVTLAGGFLEVRQGRRPPQRLVPLTGNLFFVEGDPGRRYAFDRDADGKTAVLEQRFADGEIARHSRS
jgi:hypothetical protein